MCICMCDCRHDRDIACMQRSKDNTGHWFLPSTCLCQGLFNGCMCQVSWPQSFQDSLPLSPVFPQECMDFGCHRWLYVGSVGLISGLQTCKAIALSTEPSFQPRYGFSFGITMKRGRKCETQGYRGVAAAAGGS